jgi:hypothetical protein
MNIIIMKGKVHTLQELSVNLERFKNDDDA